MKVEELLNLRWKQVKDWSKLTGVTKENGEKFVCRTDIDNFVNGMYRNLANRLLIPCENLEKIIKSKNQDFYSLKEELFRGRYDYSILDVRIVELKNSFQMPDLSGSEEDIVTDSEMHHEGFSDDIGIGDFLREIFQKMERIIREDFFW